MAWHCIDKRCAALTLLRLFSLSCATLVIAALLSCGDLSASADEDFYHGKTVRLLIGTAPASDADFQGRILARYLNQYVAGTPKIIPQDMPGSGSVIMMNYLYNVANRDGTAMGIVVGGIYMRHLFGDQGIMHNLSEMIPIYNPEGGGAVIFASAKLGLRNPKDILNVKRPVAFGFDTPEGNSAILGQAGLKMLGVPYQAISGYPGSHDVSLAVERGELDIGWNTSGAYKSMNGPMVEEGSILPLFQTGIWLPRTNEIVPHPDIPEVPTFDAFYRELKGEAPSGPLWDAWFAPLISYARYTIFFPPGVPKAAIDAMSAGLERTCADPKALEELRKMDLSDKCYLNDDARVITERSSEAPPEAIQALKALLK
jgi:tripartite-type tricarboxylate transporter receptor subunit TctC